MSVSRRRATSPERNPSRANISKIAWSRSRPWSVPLHAAINRFTSSADKQRGNLASRQWATAGIARAISSRKSPRKLRNRGNARREVISDCVVDVPHWLARSRRKDRRACAFHWPTSSPSVRSSSVAPRAYCRRVGSFTPRWVRNQSQKAVTRAGTALSFGTGSVEQIPHSTRSWWNSFTPKCE